MLNCDFRWFFFASIESKSARLLATPRLKIYLEAVAPLSTMTINKVRYVILTNIQLDMEYFA